MKTNNGTTWTHEPFDACDDCCVSLMRLAEAEYRAGKGAPIEDVFKRVKDKK